MGDPAVAARLRASPGENEWSAMQTVGHVTEMIPYDTVGPALQATPEPDQFQSTLELHVSFLCPVRAGRMMAQAGSFTGTATWLPRGVPPGTLREA
jgi:hypothetical protein